MIEINKTSIHGEKLTSELNSYLNFIDSIVFTNEKVIIKLKGNYTTVEINAITSIVNSHDSNKTTKEVFNEKIQKSQEYGIEFVRDFGSDNMELLYSGQITYAQIMQMMTELEPMIARLYAGSLELAKVWIQTYQASTPEIDRPYLNDARITNYINKLNSFLATL
jgi:hypothetical protein